MINNNEQKKEKKNYRPSNIFNFLKKIFLKNHSSNKKKKAIKDGDDDQNPNIYTFW